jgi:hypothetical protein
MAEIRRASAVSLAASLAEEARTYRDAALGARVQARAADALWDADRERARTLFRRAWDAAESADRAAESLTPEERRGRPVPFVRREVLSLAAKHDQALGEEFLSKMDEARKSEESANTNAPTTPNAQPPGQRFNPDQPPAAMAQRLSVAQQLLDGGDAERAVLFADAALYPVNTFGMSFLNTLREKNASAADQRFSSLLMRAVSDPAADANSVSLLSSYPFTPYLYITVRPTGNSHTRQFRGNIAPPQEMDPKVRAAFLNAAAQILLRPLPPPEQDRSTSGRMGAYVVTTRMAPLFEQFMPDKAPAIRARQSQLTQETAGTGGSRDSEILTRGIAPEKPSSPVPKAPSTSAIAVSTATKPQTAASCRRTWRGMKGRVGPPMRGPSARRSPTFTPRSGP